jgi:hypothetical protein
MLTSVAETCRIESCLPDRLQLAALIFLRLPAPCRLGALELLGGSDKPRLG